MSDPAAAEAGFAQLEAAVAIFGSALDAMDHGGPYVAMEQDGNDRIRSAFDAYPPLADLLPATHARLVSGASLADDGYDIRDEIAAARLRLAGL